MFVQRSRYSRPILAAVVLLAAALLAFVQQGTLTSAQGSPTDWQTIAEERGLTDADLRAAAMTYTPSGVLDEYLMFASGGHSGQVLVIGVPSMRLIRTIGVFTPEPWQGYGYGAGEEVLAGGNMDGHEVLWGDSHHPALSETNGEYDGQWLFIGDKANGRVAVIDLRDFETKQIVANPLFRNDHGGTFVTPNTGYIIEGGQYGLPLGGEYAPISAYEDSYRGIITFWRFDREAGRIDESQSLRWNCRLTGKTCVTRAKARLRAGFSATPSIPRWQRAASKRATHRSRQASPVTPPTICTSST